jgi:hypothetical protein
MPEPRLGGSQRPFASPPSSSFISAVERASINMPQKDLKDNEFHHIEQMKIGGFAQLAIVVGVFLILCVIFPPLGQFVIDLFVKIFHLVGVLG